MSRSDLNLLFDKDDNGAEGTRFQLALDCLGLKLTPREYDVLCGKYKVWQDGTVDYIAFVEDASIAIGKQHQADVSAYKEGIGGAKPELIPFRRSKSMLTLSRDSPCWSKSCTRCRQSPDGGRCGGIAVGWEARERRVRW